MNKVLLSMLALVALAGCVNAPTPKTPAQVLDQVSTQVCPVVQAALIIIPGLDGVSTDAKKQAMDAADKVNAVCTNIAKANTKVGSADLEDLVKNALPVVFNILMAVPDPNPTVVAAKDGILIAQALLPILIAQVKAAEPVATVAAPAK